MPWTNLFLVQGLKLKKWFLGPKSIFSESLSHSEFNNIKLVEKNIFKIFISQVKYKSNLRNENCNPRNEISFSKYLIINEA